MRNVNFMEELLDGSELEWKTLGEVCRFINGRAYKQPELLEQGRYPVLRVGNFFTNDNWYYSNLELDEDKYCDRGDLLYAWSASFGPRIWDGNKVIYHYHIWKVVPDANVINKKFLYYLLDWDTKALKEEQGTGSTMMHVTKGAIEKRLVPIPCPENPEKSLEIQAEVVRILDTFTELTAELTAELTVRKKQYDHYREQLLSFKEREVEWKTLDEVSNKISSGGTPKTGVPEYYDGDIPWLRTQEVDFREIWDTGVKITEAGVKNSSAKWIPANCVIIAMYGATVGKIGINKIPMTTNQACANISLNEKVANYRYVFHYLSSQYEYIKSLGAGSQTNINAQIVKGLRVPIPYARDPEKSLAEQGRIVSILDKFDALTSSLTEGLPREIELRKKQYEHYRDLLLSFPKPKEVEA